MIVRASSPNRPALPAVRQWHAVAILRTHGFVSCRDLRDAFEISEATARRDITALVQSGAARRIHGGAMLSNRA
jgi:DeoR/GlpR family transcriptional regulator of sugar metabolism